ncbi:FMN reductase [Rudaeicoccus suwonensis]|uniref:FMN reductase n=1 Tax=Rudaeicoccus suwonensis TaxID=657409 RepID=A0A561EC24_9MICO|nr:FMN reductase [Rudaeicoccus suwonensis]TWE13160.1 FMN reductase [Rudaeicoccus suwonensis]
MNRSLVVITAGLSQPSTTRLLADRISGAVAAELTARGEAIDIQVIELRELAVDLATMMATAGMPTARLDRARELVSDAAGLIVVTPVFAASYSGVFKMFFDALDPDALNGMPVIIAATAGTARHSMVLDHALRPLLTHLRAVVMSTGIFAATDDFGSGEQGHHLTERIGRAANELAGQLAHVAGQGLDNTDALATPERPERTSGVTIDAKVTPFARLLQGHTGS